MRFVRLFLVVCSTVAGLILGLDKLALPIIPGKDIGFAVTPEADGQGPFLRIEKGVGEIECWLRVTASGADPDRQKFAATMGPGTPLGVAWEKGSLIVTDPRSPNGKRQFTWYAGDAITLRQTEGPVQKLVVTDWEVFLKDGPPESKAARIGRRAIQAVLFSLLVLGALAGLYEAYEKLTPSGAGDAANPARIVKAVIGTIRAEENERHAHTPVYRTYLMDIVIDNRSDGQKVMAALLPDEAPGVRYLARLGAVGAFKTRLGDLIAELQVFRNRAA